MMHCSTSYICVTEHDCHCKLSLRAAMNIDMIFTPPGDKSKTERTSRVSPSTGMIIMGMLRTLRPPGNPTPRREIMRTTSSRKSTFRNPVG